MGSIGLILFLLFTLFFILFFSDNKVRTQNVKFVFINSLILLGSISFILLLSSNLNQSFFNNIYFISSSQSTAVIIILFFNRKNLNISEYKNIKFDKIGIVFLLSIVFIFIITTIQEILGSSGSNVLTASTKYSMIDKVIFYCLLPAVFEEFFFRELIFKKLLNVFTKRNTIIITAVLFYIFHLFELPFLVFIWLIPIGLFYGYIRTKYDNVIYSVFSHFLLNFMIVINFTYG